MQYKTATLDGNLIAYTDTTVFRVEVGRYKNSYVPRYTLTGNLPQAVTYYNAINIGRGYKKRLVMVGAKSPVLAKQVS